MKTQTIYLILLFLPFVAWSQEPNFVLKGKFSDVKTKGKVFLSFNDDGITIKDSADVSAGGFSLRGYSKGVKRATLTFRNGNKFPSDQKNASDTKGFYLEAGITTFSTKDSMNNATITGSAVNADAEIYNALFTDIFKERNRTRLKLRILKPDDSTAARTRKDLLKRLTDLEDQSASMKLNYIRQHPSSFFSLMSIHELGGAYLDQMDIQPLLDGLSPELRKSREGIALQQMVDHMKGVVIGKMAPQFAHLDTSGKMVQLNDFKGQYILLDFWASWCHPCRAENPNVLKAYNKYKNKNFTVLGVSIDRDTKKNDWLKAIHEDGMPWTQLLDGSKSPDGASARYGIKSIPSNFLIDPTGKIIAKNLRGEDLQKTLDEVLK